MISEFSDMSLIPNTHYFDLCRHQDPPNDFDKKHEPLFKKHLLEAPNCDKSKLRFCFVKDGCRTIMKIRLLIFENLEYWTNIFQKA